MSSSISQTSLMPFVMPDLEKIEYISQRFSDKGYILKYNFQNREFELWTHSGIIEKFLYLWELDHIEWIYRMMEDILSDEFPHDSV